MKSNVPAAIDIAAALVLASIAWLAYFQLCSALGLYQDDAFMYHIVRDTHDGVLREAFDLSRGYGGEGRPATQVVMVLLTWVGSVLGGVTGLYVVGWIVLSALAALAFVALRQLFSPSTSLLAAAFYVLYPADAAKFFAVSYMGNVGGALFWICAWLLLQGRAIVAALVLAATFAMGEAFILPGLLLPLLVFADGRRAMRDALRIALRFLAAYGAIIVPAIVLRLIYAPGRATQAMADPDRIALLQKMIASVYLGMRTSASTFHGRALEFLDSPDSLGWTVALAVAALVFVAARWLDRNRGRTSMVVAAAPLPLRAGFLIAFGLLAWAASYPLYGLYPARFPPTNLVGKLTNVHAQGAIGATFLVAGALWAIERFSMALPSLTRAVTAAMALGLGLVAGYFVQVQERYVDNWKFQLSFWRQIPQALPDLKPLSLVVVETVGAESTRLEGVSPFDWSMPYIYSFVWKAPGGDSAAPLFITQYFYETLARNRGDRVDIAGYPTIGPRSFAKADVIRLRVEAGRFARVDANASAEARAGFPLFQDELVSPRWTPRPLRLRDPKLADATVTPNNYSSSDWRNGIASSGGNAGRMFYFIVPNLESNPVRVGSTLRFAASGDATATRVDVSPQGSVHAVFVSVDRPLDPLGDGYPHPVLVKEPR